MLNELDKELGRRGLQFVRYADDCVIFEKSKKAANRIMENITRYIEIKLKLKVNREKSKVDRPWRIKYLGFSFYQAKGKIEIRVHPRKSYWRKSNSPILSKSLNNKTLERLGYKSLSSVYC